MIVFGAPGFLLAGVLAALVPAVLHLIRRRPPSRAPLPTARFLSEDPRTSVRLGRPSDLLLLALRVLLLLLAGTALARPAWVAAPEGTTEIVLLDRGVARTPAEWQAAVRAARGVLLDGAGRSRGELVLFDTAAARVRRNALGAVFFDSLASSPPAGAGVRYADALRALNAAARELRGADSVRATLVSPLRWAGWDAGLAPLRRAAWPGALRLVEVPAGAQAADSVRGSAGKRAVVVAAAGAGRFVAAALAAAGWQVERVPPGALPEGDAYVLLSGAPEPLLERARRGATVVFAGQAPDGVPWDFGTGAGARGGEVWFPEGMRLEGGVERQAGRPASGARALAAWDDGRVAAAAAPLGSGCVVYFGAALEAGNLPLSVDFPRAVDRLARGCEPPSAESSATLDAGARAVLRGGGAEVLPAGAVARRSGGMGLGRWVMAVALLAALAETWLAYFRRGSA
ncbi:MAG TPA: BatA domain-containing protein [Longimicrobiaceae bacterium]|nr:BatA domain-containing protein [Longimicrobiaceae bacterium]